MKNADCVTANYKDCFAYNPKKNECECLTDLYCEKEGKCNFYKYSVRNQREREEKLTLIKKF